MKTFVLTLKYDDAANYADLRESLRYVSKYTTDYRGPREVLEDGDDAEVKSPTGDVIGTWEIDEDADPADVAFADGAPTAEELAKEEAARAELPKYVPPTPAQWWKIAEAIAETIEGAQADVEGGGAACPFIDVTLPDGRVILFGDVNETWGGDVYECRDKVSGGEPLENVAVLTDIPTSDLDPAKIAKAFRNAVTDVCIAGAPAILGRCGDPDCVCSPAIQADAKAEFKAALESLYLAADRLDTAWNATGGDYQSGQYQAYLPYMPSFDEFLAGLGKWIDDIRTAK